MAETGCGVGGVEKGNLRGKAGRSGEPERKGTAGRRTVARPGDGGVTGVGRRFWRDGCGASGGQCEQFRGLEPVVRANLDRACGRALPRLAQFGADLWARAHGDCGPSTHGRDFSVNDLFATAWPISLTLGAEAMARAVFLGVPLGLAGATRRRAWRGSAD